MTLSKPVSRNLNIVPFVSVDQMMKLVHGIGIELFLKNLAQAIAEDFSRWEHFEKSPRLASHSPEGVIELMPTSDGRYFGFKYVNGHPKNTRAGRQTVAALGMLSDVATGYPVLISEMTILTALRTAAMSALAARYLAPSHATTMAIIGNGAQCEFQALAFKAVLGMTTIRLYDCDGAATRKAAFNLARHGLKVHTCSNAMEAIEGAHIITTVTADKQHSVILTDNMVGSGIHINAVGGDCPGKTEIHPDVLLRSDIFAEYLPQTRIEGELQQLAADHPAQELWAVIAGRAAGRQSSAQITLFDSVGFAIEDFSALRVIYDYVLKGQVCEQLDLIADPDDPRDLFGMLMRAAPQTSGKKPELMAV